MKRFFMLLVATAFICGTASAANAVTTTTPASDECNKANLENWKLQRTGLYNENKTLSGTKANKAKKAENNGERRKLTRRIKSCAEKLRKAKLANKTTATK